MVSSEIGQLKKVIVHYPDDGIEMVTPKLAENFLYDDIVFLARMREEHKLFTDVLNTFLGENQVYDTQQMLQEALKGNTEGKEKLLNYVFEHEDCSETTQELLKYMSNEDLAFTLFTGLNKQSWKLLFSPLPNYVFTRDIGVFINDYILICQASKQARTRENILTRFIVYFHPIFKGLEGADKIIDFTKEDGDLITIEGGDLMMFDKETLLIGQSERTSNEAIELLTSKLFDKDVVKRIVKIEIPKERSCMHIDTLFTQISQNDFVVYEPYLLKQGKIKITVTEKEKGIVATYSTLSEFLTTINTNAKFILCGKGEYPYDEREQWTDGCNLVAVKDSVAIAYGRNEMTAEALKDAGYKVVDAKTFIEANKSGLIDANEVNNLIINLPSTELSRARGGPHCMTFPIERD